MEDILHQHYTDINSRNHSVVLNDIKVPTGCIAGYAIISIVGKDALSKISDLEHLSLSSIFKLKVLHNLKVYGKTGITTCNTTSARALQVIGAITRGKKGVSSFVDKMYSKLCENPEYEVVHLIIGIDCRPGQREIDELIIEAEIIKTVMNPLCINVLNLPGQKQVNRKYKRQRANINLALKLGMKNALDSSK